MIFHKFHMAAILFVILCLLCIGTGGNGFAQEVDLVPEGTSPIEEKALLDLINEARKDPLRMAVSMGMDPDKILLDLPELHTILTQGLPALGFDRNLYEAARGHAEEMLANNYYSYDSLDGRSYDERIRETGYAPLSTGESLGFLAFNNFIESDYAVQVIFEKMYKEELDPDRTGQRNILNPDLREAGVSVVAGMFVSSGAPWNVYMAVVDFADSLDLYAVERHLWRLVNEARKSPLKMLDAVGIDGDLARELMDEDAWILNQGLPPVAWNEKLEESALSHYSDMYTHYYYSTLSLDGTTPAERIANGNYLAQQAGEALGYMVISGSVNPMEVARVVFESMLIAEMGSDASVEKFILNPDIKEIGVACGKVYLDTGEDKEGVVLISVVDFALPIDPASFMLGNIYEDLDVNSIYSPWEGVEGLTFSVGLLGAEEEPAIVKTDSLGNYQVEIAQGFLEFAVADDSGEILASDMLLRFDGGSLLLDVRVEIEEENMPAADSEMKTGPLLNLRVPSLTITW